MPTPEKVAMKPKSMPIEGAKRPRTTMIAYRMMVDEYMMVLFMDL